MNTPCLSFDKKIHPNCQWKYTLTANGNTLIMHSRCRVNQIDDCGYLWQATHALRTTVFNVSVGDTAKNILLNCMGKLIALKKIKSKQRCDEG